MRASTTYRRTPALVASSLVFAVVVGCGGQSDNNQTTTDANAPPSTGGDGSVTTGPDDGSVVNPTDGSVTTPPPVKLKAIGSPCTTDSQCEAGLSCNTTYNICTKACAADTECAGKKGAVGGCVNSLCFAECVVPPDGGVVSDAGKVKAPCKDKTFDCVSLPDHAVPLCLPPTAPNPDGGTPGPDSGPTDSGPTDSASPG